MRGSESEVEVRVGKYHKRQSQPGNYRDPFTLPAELPHHLVTPDWTPCIYAYYKPASGSKFFTFYSEILQNKNSLYFLLN